MKKGDIDNTVVPATVIVFEGLLGLLENTKDRALEASYRKAHQWNRAANRYVLNETMVKMIWDMTWRTQSNIDAVTWMGDDMAEAIADRLTRDNVPVRNVYSFTPTRFAREIAYMPWVSAIFDPDPSHRFLYGGKGRLMSATDYPDLRN